MRRKSDPGKLTMVARLRQETTLSLKAIAVRADLGTSKRANARLHAWLRNEPAGSAGGSADVVLTWNEKTNQAMG